MLLNADSARTGPLMKNDPAQNVNNATVGKCCPRVSPAHFTEGRTAGCPVVRWTLVAFDGVFIGHLLSPVPVQNHESGRNQNTSFITKKTAGERGFSLLAEGDW